MRAHFPPVSVCLPFFYFWKAPSPPPGSTPRHLAGSFDRIDFCPSDPFATTPSFRDPFSTGAASRPTLFLPSACADRFPRCSVFFLPIRQLKTVFQFVVPARSLPSLRTWRKLCPFRPLPRFFFHALQSASELLTFLSLLGPQGVRSTIVWTCFSSRRLFRAHVSFLRHVPCDRHDVHGGFAWSSLCLSST